MGIFAIDRYIVWYQVVNIRGNNFQKGVIQKQNLGGREVGHWIFIYPPELSIAYVPVMLKEVNFYLFYVENFLYTINFF